MIVSRIGIICSCKDELYTKFNPKNVYSYIRPSLAHPLRVIASLILKKKPIHLANKCVLLLPLLYQQSSCAGSVASGGQGSSWRPCRTHPKTRPRRHHYQL